MTDDDSASGGSADLVNRFPTCACGRRTCVSCRRGWQLTPRMAASLRFVAQITADDAYDDVEAHGSEPVPLEPWDWSLFDLYPRSTQNADTAWRREAARAYDDLAADIDAGIWPLPRSGIEQLALHEILVRLRDWFADREVFHATLWDELEPLPQHPADEDVSGAWEHLSDDDEELGAYPAEEGDPTAPALAHQDWLTRFDDAEERDAARGFRR